MTDLVFWFFWILTASLCGWVFVEAFRKPLKLLEWPFMASVMWAYFYVYMSYDAKTTLGDFVDEYEVIGQFTALLGFLFLLLGWKTGFKKAPNRKAKSSYPNIHWMLLIGLFFLLLGAYGGNTVAADIKEGRNVLQESSAYWYLLFYVGYPGLALAVWAASKWHGGYQYLVWAAIAASLVIFLYPHIERARRGPTFPVAIVLLLVPALARRKAPNPLLFVTVLGGTGLVMISFLSIRGIIYKGGTWAEALTQLDVGHSISSRGKNIYDNEFVNHCHTIATLADNGKINYGTGHLGVLLHWIPRSLYKEKPFLGGGQFCSFDELFNDIERHCGVYLLGGSGASNAGVADSFFQYGWIFPLFWYALGWLFARVYHKGFAANNARWSLTYVGIMCASHWLISQSLPSAAVPCLVFIVVPQFVLFICPKSAMPSDKLSVANAARNSRPAQARPAF